MSAIPALDNDQRAAYGEDRNVVVSAGAGSGKTTVLAERYVRLVTERGLGVDQILTLTFTRKAAAEMYARIYRRLSETDHPKAQEQLARFDSARISTLDSFCTAVARGACHRYGIAPDFVVDEARLRRMAEETAVELLMERRTEGLVGRLVATRSFDSLRSDFLADLAVSHIPILGNTRYRDLAEAQIRFLEGELPALCGEISDLGSRILSIDGSSYDGASLAEAWSALEELIPLDPASGIADPERLERTAEFLSSSKSFSAPRSNVKNPALLELRELALPLKDAAGRLAVLAGTLARREDLRELGELLDDYASRFLSRKRAEGILSFHDAADLAVDILKSDGELRRHYKQRIRAIMIDEFQDNNVLQKSLLFLLAERDDLLSPGVPEARDLAPDKLFFVGDEKQSIYRFRGADVSVFRRLAGELSRSLTMGTNYRSTPALVGLFNALFPGVFGEAREPYEAAFRPIGAGPLRSDAAATAGPDAYPPMEIHLLETSTARDDGVEEGADSGAPGAAAGADAVSKADAEALAAARRVAAGAESGEFAYSDVAVLFRTTTNQGAYERAFRAAGIPFAAADPRGVFTEAVANDFYALFRLALFPTDRNAYGTVLRSPFVRLGDDAFVRIMLDALKEGGTEPFPQEAQESWFVREADRRRYAQGAALYAMLRTQADRRGIADLTAELWYGWGYRAVLLEEERAASCLEHFELLYDLALDADRRRLTLSAFLDELAPLMGTSEKIEGNEGSRKGNAVSFMTVHKSKGLEFPVVIIADAGSLGAPARNAKPYYLDPDFGPVANLKDERAARNKKAVNYFYERGRKLEEGPAAAELKRLLYVAATRAERLLLVFGSVGLNKEDREALAGIGGEERLRTLLRRAKTGADGEARAKSFLDLIARGLAAPEGAEAAFAVFPVPRVSLEERRMLLARTAADLRALSREESGGASERRTALFDAPPRAVPAGTRRTVSPTRMEALRAPAGAPTGAELPGLLVDGLLRNEKLQSAFGTLCHGAVEALLGGREGGMPPEAAEALREAALPPADRSALEAEALRLARAFLASPAGREAAAAARRRSEFPFILPLPLTGNRPMLVQGKIDLIYESGGSCVVVDFKTDRVADPEAHRVQMECYRAAAAAFSDLPVKLRLCYLRSMEIREVEPRMDRGELAVLAAAAGCARPDTQGEGT